MNNEQLAAAWQDDVQQVVVVWPLVWKHLAGGDWYVAAYWQAD